MCVRLTSVVFRQLVDLEVEASVDGEPAVLPDEDIAGADDAI